MNGIINVYKEPGFTSFDVVAKLRGILKQKKIGHTGTLDPQAEGVLPVALGKATKLCEMLTDGTKEYRAEMLLGKVTDTLDAEGTVLEEREVTCSEDEVREAVMSFTGAQQQVPPMYSALKINGRKLYELARKGEVVHREPRNIFIYNIDILDIDLPKVIFKVKCSKGTYIRSLCDDIGRKLGCGAIMQQLTRTASGGFSIENAMTLSQIEELVKNGQIDSAVLSMETALSDLAKVNTLPQADVAVRNGNKVHKDNASKEGECGAEIFTDKEQVRMYDSEGLFVGIYEYRKEDELLRPVKILF